MAEKESFWGVVEVMGHQAYAGEISQEEVAGVAMVRVDVPESGNRPAFTKFLGASAVYAITPLSEELAKARAEALVKTPVSTWDLGDVLRRLPAVAAGAERDDDIPY